jgi:prepilin-type N-terminal cleavage/methylation domain-containing protein
VLTTMRNRRGYTLVELLIVMIIMVTVTGGMLRLLNTSQRLSRAQAERVDLQSNVRIGSIVVPAELREINTYAGSVDPFRTDILNKTATSINYRAMRGIGFVCAGSTTTQLRLSSFSGVRASQAVRDAAYVFSEGANPDTGNDDSWLPVSITGVATSNTCGNGTVELTVAPALAAAPPVGTPVRTYEQMQLSLYQLDGKSWLGVRSLSGGDLTPRPLLGPLKDVDGLNLAYLAANGAAPATNADVKSIVLTIRGVTSEQVSSGGGNAHAAYVQDSLVSQVSLRNAFRP